MSKLSVDELTAPVGHRKEGKHPAVPAYTGKKIVLPAGGDFLEWLEGHIQSDDFQAASKTYRTFRNDYERIEARRQEMNDKRLELLKEMADLELPDDTARASAVQREIEILNEEDERLLTERDRAEAGMGRQYGRMVPAIVERLPRGLEQYVYFAREFIEGMATAAAALRMFNRALEDADLDQSFDLPDGYRELRELMEDGNR